MHKRLVDHDKHDSPAAKGRAIFLWGFLTEGDPTVGGIFYFFFIGK
jgi:hypothetical protein